MIYKRSYQSETDKEKIIKEMHTEGKFLREIQQLIDGKFLVFEDVSADDLRLNTLESQNALYKAQIQANSDRTDFHEDLIADLAMRVYE
ncbi:hypothetical protein ABEV54_18215 [Peribacillus psychrosaccharolyticus]|uniref:hypothetical protein n=1 Tax=Peribacillus psychrosaccharolyticus TaxID=1407 RepID=UPI003D2D27D6